MTYLRALRIANGITLDALASALGSQRSTISTAERFPHTAGPRLRKKLSKHFGVPFASLQKRVDHDQLTAAIINNLMEQK